MRIINTVKSSKFKVHSSKPKPKSKDFSLGVPILLICLLAVTLGAGCNFKSEQDQAKEDIRQSQSFYESAIKQYKGLISKGRDLDRLYFELGSLYFSHGEFEKAIDAFKKSKNPMSQKYLAISYFRTGNWTDAFEIFSRNEPSEDESSYYYGLTAERLNLFDKALGIYRKIGAGNFKDRARMRIDAIERQASPGDIKDIDPEASKIIGASASESEYPQAGAIVLLADEKFEITPDGKQVADMHYIIKILNERGKEKFSETAIDYDSTYEKVELGYARTISPQGRVTDVGSRHIRDVSKYLNFPIYSNAHVYIISFPDISEGAVIEYRFKIIRNQLINKKDFVLSYPVQASEPIARAEFRLKTPPETKLHIDFLNREYNNFSAVLEPKVQKDSTGIVYSWGFRDIPQIIPETKMPPDIEVNPTIVLSSFSGWQDLYAWWWNLAKDKIKADGPIKEKIRALLNGKGTPEEKIRAIYNFCAQEIRYVAVEYGQAGYEPHAAQDTFKNKYGDCKDKAILLVTMLREAGFSASPVLISTKSYYNLREDFPSMLFNHAIAIVDLGEESVFMDATAETCAFGDLPADDQQRRVLVFKNDGYAIKTTPLFSPGHNLLKQVLNINTNADETLSADKTILTFGLYDQSQRYWLRYTTPELIGETLKQKIQEISIGGKLKDYEIKNLDDLNTPVVLKFWFSGPEYFTEAGRLRIMPQLASLDTSLVAKEARRFPIDFGVLESKEMIFEIAIPTDFVVKYIPESISEDSPWFGFKAEYSSGRGKVYLKQKSELKRNLVEAKEYPAFKAFFEGLAKKLKQRIILEKTR